LRIGTWNLDARWSADREAVLLDAECDVWLLTEVSPDAIATDGCIAGNHVSVSSGRMARDQFYAAVLSRKPLTPLEASHGAVAAAAINGHTFMSCVLPFPNCKAPPDNLWRGENFDEMARPVLDVIRRFGKADIVIWGGDFNQNIAGKYQWIGSSALRESIVGVIDELDQQIPTSQLPHTRIEDGYTIDQIAVPKCWEVLEACRISSCGLSDHDLYVVEVAG